MKNVFLVHTVLVGTLAMQLATATWAQQDNAARADAPPLQYSIVGSSSCDTKPCYSEVMQSIPVQKALLALARQPDGLPATRFTSISAGINVPDLLALRLIRFESERYYLNFALFTAEDVGRIREVSELYAQSLAGAMLKRRADIEATMQEYDAPGIDPKVVSYFLLGCVSLDWDGLELTEAKGYRKASDDRLDGRYVPHAQEQSEATLQRIFWGSHNEMYDGIRVTSFGDHYSLPRYMLPDLLWRTPDFPASYPDTLAVALDDLLSETFARSGYQLGRIMLALRDSEKSGAELTLAANVSEGEGKALLRVLVELDYIRGRDGLYQALIPVLTERDQAMTQRIRAIGGQVMEQWLEANYDKMKLDLASLSFTRSGVPFGDGYTMIWHYLFGMANQKLVEAGLFADPYASTRKYPGAIPAIYTLALQAP